MEYKTLDSTIPLRSNRISPWAIPFIVFIFLGIPFSFYLPSWATGLIGVGTFIIAALGSSQNNIHVNRPIGKMNISHELIDLGHGQVFQLSEIKSLILSNNGFVEMVDGGRNDASPISGIADIEIVNLENITFNARFLVENQTQYHHLQSVLRTLYKAKISITENYGYKTKALLLEPLKSYQQTQALKEELGI